MNVATNAPRRSILHYYGGKWRLAPWIISHFPEHRIYTEVFGGAASVLLQKPRCYSEVLNDLDDELVNLFRVLRDPDMSKQLIHQVMLTPYSRSEFVESYKAVSDPIEQARRTLFRSSAGFGSGAACGHQTGFRANATASYTTPAQDWSRFWRAIEPVTKRLSGVVIECKPAIDVLTAFDGEGVLHYVDPPYLLSTRNQNGHYNGVYRHEFGSDSEHIELANVLKSLDGFVVLSGYHSPLYGDLFSDWKAIERTGYSDGQGERQEVLWLSPRTVEALNKPRQARLL